MKYLLLLMLVSCAYTPQVHNILEKQRLVVRPQYTDGLTNQVCIEKDVSGDCTKFSIKKYDLNDQVVRTTLNELRFICYIGGKRYRICLDKAGLCRRDKGKCTKHRRKNIIFGKMRCVRWATKNTFIPITNTSLLYGAVCKSLTNR